MAGTLLSFFWGAGSGLMVNLITPKVEQLIRRLFDGHGSLDRALWFDYYRAFFVALDDVCTNADGKSDQQLVKDAIILKKGLKVYLTETNFFPLIRAFQKFSQSNLESFLFNLSRSNQEYINELALFLYVELNLDNRLDLERVSTLAVLSEVLCLFSSALAALTKSGSKQHPVMRQILALEKHMTEMDPRYRVCHGLDTLSQIAARDANVIEYIAGIEGKVAITLEDIYVSRIMEQEILHEAADGEGNIAIIKGEAGSGKTSLLWKVYRELVLDPSCKVWYLKANQFRDVDIAGGIAFYKSVFRHRKVVLLVDTIDVLINRESDKDYLISTLNELTSEKNLCKVLVTTRPHEASILRNYHQILPFSRDKTIRDYDLEVELPLAVKKHVRYYYLKGDLKKVDPELEYQRIIEAVYNGKSLREICLKPLTLRMLFTVYAPYDVPDEINVFDLYHAFWKNKVPGEFRPGSRERTDDRDLTQTCYLAAVLMMAEGKPYVAKRKFDRLLVRYGIPDDEIAILQNRGILIRSARGENTRSGFQEDEDIAFFHQTFFEFCAAKAIFHFLSGEAIGKLEEKAFPKDQDTIYNYFLLPVYEQLLLWVAATSSPRKIEKSLKKLLAGDRVEGINSGVLVYLLLEESPMGVTELVRRQIQGKYTTPIILRYLNLAPNIKVHRLEDILVDLKAVWGRRDPTLISRESQEKINVLKVLNRYSKEFPEWVLRFFKEQGIVDYFIRYRIKHGTKQHDPSLHFITNTFRNLIDFDRDYIFESIIQLFNQVGDKFFRGELLAMLNQFYDQFGKNRLATYLSSALKLDKVSFQRKAEFHLNILLPVGKLWEKEWTRHGVAIDQIIKAIHQTNGKVQKYSQLYGLGLFLIHQPVEDVALLRRHVDQMPVGNDLMLWQEIILKTVFSNSQPGNLAFDYLYGLFEQFVEGVYVRKLEEKGNEVILATVYDKLLDFKTIPVSPVIDSVVARRQLSDNYFFHRWLTGPQFLELRMRVAAVALMEGNKALGALLETELSAYLKQNQKRLSRLCGCLREPAFRDRNVAEWYWRLCLWLENGLDFLSSYFKKVASFTDLDPAFRMLPDDLVKALRQLFEHHIRSPKGALRYKALELRESLTQLGILPPLPLSEIAGHLANETLDKAEKALINMIGSTGLETENEVVRALELVRQYLDRPGVKRNAQFQYIWLSTRRAQQIADPNLAYEILMQDFDLNINAPKIKLFPDLVLKILETEPKAAIELMLKYMTSVEVNDQSYGTQKDLAHNIRFACISLFQGAPDECLEKMVRVLPQLNDHFAITWVSAMFSNNQNHSRVSTLLYDLLNSNAVNSVVEDAIHNQLDRKRKPMGSEEWVELYDYVKG